MCTVYKNNRCLSINHCAQVVATCITQHATAGAAMHMCAPLTAITAAASAAGSASDTLRPLVAASNAQSTHSIATEDTTCSTLPYNCHQGTALEPRT
jgi:hypothetical protein